MSYSKNGYPISNYLRKNDGYHMTYASLEVACHAVEKHCDKLKTGEFAELKVCYFNRFFMLKLFHIVFAIFLSKILKRFLEPRTNLFLIF